MLGLYIKHGFRLKPSRPLIYFRKQTFNTRANRRLHVLPVDDGVSEDKREPTLNVYINFDVVLHRSDGWAN
jgi:hypothetical protein